MIDYTVSLMWLAFWPVVIYGSYKLVEKNINKMENIK